MTNHARPIEVRPNNFIVNEPCAICGSRCDPTGIDPFIAGTWECDQCAERIGALEEVELFRGLEAELNYPEVA